MKDKNGKEIKTGDVVRISGAYFQKDNSLWIVEHTPGDYSWSGKDLGLRKLTKTGRIPKRDNVGFWPITVTVSDYWKKVEAKAWNEDHAEIEIVDLENMDAARELFEGHLAASEAGVEWSKDHGYWADVPTYKLLAEHWAEVLARM